MRKAIMILIGVILVAGAWAIARLLIITAPTAERKRPPRAAIPVEVQTLQARQETVVLHLTGTVKPDRDIMLRARVSGEVVSMVPNLVEGGLLSAGDPILEIDPVDYRLARETAAAALEQARFNHKLELGRQEVAKREWSLLKTDDASNQEKELALREPQLEASEAALKSAEAGLERADLNLERTRITAPFNAIVLERDVNIGSQVMANNTMLAHLVGTDIYRVVVSIPVDRLKWVRIPGSEAVIHSASGAKHRGRVARLLADLETQGRMARLLVEVEDPLGLREDTDGLPLLLDEFVQVNIQGEQLKDVYSIPRNALHENGIIWLAEDGRLDIRSVSVLWRDAEQVLIRDGLRNGDQLIISDLTAPVQGMDVSLDGDDSPNGRSEPPAKKD